MPNETFLIFSYFLFALICLGLGLAVYLWLRRPFERVIGALPRRAWSSVLKKSFPLSTLLFAFSAFLSVRYYGGCENRLYKDIVADRAYMIAKNQEQLSRTLNSLAVDLFLWAAILILTLLINRRGKAEAKSRGEDEKNSQGIPS
jgi:hypothetical protein